MFFFINVIQFCALPKSFIRHFVLIRMKPLCYTLSLGFQHDDCPLQPILLDTVRFITGVSCQFTFLRLFIASKMFLLSSVNCLNSNSSVISITQRFVDIFKIQTDFSINSTVIVVDLQFDCLSTWFHHFHSSTLAWNVLPPKWSIDDQIAIFTQKFA